jgi:hypothetical protein
MVDLTVGAIALMVTFRTLALRRVARAYRQSG